MRRNKSMNLSTNVIKIDATADKMDKLSLINWQYNDNDCLINTYPFTLFASLYNILVETAVVCVRRRFFSASSCFQS
jgi:hypothetical protein